MNILIRTSGGKAPKKELGFGHIYRCINLAHFLKPNKLFFLVEDFGGAKKIFKNYNYEIYSIQKNIDTQLDIQKTKSIISRKKIDLLVIDKYKVKIPYIEELRKTIKVVVISDLKNINYRCNLIANGFIGFRNQITYNKYGTKCLLGPKYQILNPEFSKGREDRKKDYDFLITFGGYDENELTLKVIKVLGEFSKVKAKVILGPATKKSKKIIDFLQKKSKNLNVISKTSNMHQEITRSRFGICSGGITSYEFAALGLKFWIICQEKHQLATAQEWQNRGYAENLGLGTKITESKIKNVFNQFVESNLIDKHVKRQIVDGLGGKRVAKEINNLL